MLKSLTLKNFKRHADLTVQFTEGLNLITGPNFSGKSTILQGILYALGGPSAVPGGAAIVTRRGHSGTEVTLAFQANDSDYTVVRKAKSATLIRDGKEIAKSSSAVTAHLAELLGMNTKRFSQLRYGEQKKTESLLTIGAAELHAVIQELAQAEVINTVIDRCSKASTLAKGGLEAIPDTDLLALESGVSELTTELNTEYTRLNEELAKVEQLSAKARQTKVDYQQAQALEGMREKLRKEYGELLLAIERERITLAQAEAECSRLNGMSEAYNMVTDKLARKQTELENLRAEVTRAESLQRSILLLTGRIDDTLKLGQKQELELADLGEVITTAGHEHILEVSKDELAETSREHARLESALASGVCPACNRPYEENPGWRDEITTQKIAAYELLGQQTVEVKALEAELKGIIDSNARITQLEYELETTQKTVLHQRADLDRMREAEELLGDGVSEADLAILKQEVYQLTGDMQRAHEAAVQLSQAEGNKQLALGRIEQYTERWDEIGQVPPPEDLGDHIALMQTTETEARTALDAYNQKLQGYTSRTGVLQGLTTQLERARNDHHKRKELSARLHGCQSLAKYLRENRDRYLGKVWAGITNYAGEFASSCTGGAVESVARTDKGEFSYSEKGEEFPVAAASGLQRSVMGLGIQIAMSQMMPSPLSSLLLDEPSADADEERSLAMSSLLAATHDQIIMVSHRQLDGAVASNTIEMEA